MSATTRIVTGLLAVGMIAGPAPAHADESPRPVDGAVTLESLPVDAVDVTESDASLRSTTAEVTVLVDDGRGSPEVSKLRAGSAAQAAQLVAHLDAQPGVVAARTGRMRAFGAVNPEPLAPQQWNLARVGAPDAWGSSAGAGVVVAVVDTGVDASHPDLAGRVLPEIDLVPGATRRAADNDHGTRVASLIGAGLNGVGMAGVAPEARILPVAALDASGVGDTSTVARGIIAAADAGARVINLSLGGPVRDPVLDRACRYAYEKGAILVAAAGNSYQFGNEVQYPAASPHVVAVAAVDSRGRPSPFSNSGAHIDLAAPGQDILAAIHGAGYDRQSGTSFAAPHVSAILAMAAAANPELSAAQLVAATELTAEDDASGDGRDERLGYGIVRADRAVTTALSMRPSAGSPRLRVRKFNARPEPVLRGQVATFTMRVQTRVDGAWRASAAPVTVRIQFKRKGSRYRTIARVASALDGTATLSMVPTRSGRWRAQVPRPTGGWKPSRSDHLRVRAA